MTPRCAAAAVVSAVVLRRPTKEYTHRYSMMHRRLTTAGIEVAPHYHQLLVVYLYPVQVLIYTIRHKQSNASGLSLGRWPATIPAAFVARHTRYRPMHFDMGPPSSASLQAVIVATRYVLIIPDHHGTTARNSMVRTLRCMLLTLYFSVGFGERYITLVNDVKSAKGFATRSRRKIRELYWSKFYV